MWQQEMQELLAEQSLERTKWEVPLYLWVSALCLACAPSTNHSLHSWVMHWTGHPELVSCCVHHLQLAASLIWSSVSDLVACMFEGDCALQNDDTWRITTQIVQGCNGKVWRCISAEFPGCVLKEGPFQVIEEEAQKMAPLCHPALLRPFAVLEPKPGSEAAFNDNAYLVLPELGQSVQKMLAAK